MADQPAAPQSQPDPQPAEAPMMTFGELEQMVSDAQAQGQVAEQQPVSDQPAPEAPTSGQAPADPFVEALSKKGFKAAEDLLKSYEEAHATITRLSQERSKLAQDMEVLMQMQNQFIAPQANRQVQQTTGQGEPPGDFNDELYKEIAPKVRQDVVGTVQAIIHEEKVKGRVEQLAQANPEEFKDLLPIMINLSKQYPQVGALPNGIEMVYEKAKEIRADRVSRLMKSVFGDDIDVDKMKSFFKAQKEGGQAASAPPPTSPPSTNQDLARAAYLPSSTQEQSGCGTGSN